MNYTRLTLAQSAAIRAANAAMLQVSRERRAKHVTERTLRDMLRRHHWSDSAVGELVEAHWSLVERGAL